MIFAYAIFVLLGFYTCMGARIPCAPIFYIHFFQHIAIWQPYYSLGQNFKGIMSYALQTFWCFKSAFNYVLWGKWASDPHLRKQRDKTTPPLRCERPLKCMNFIHKNTLETQNLNSMRPVLSANSYNSPDNRASLVA